MDKILFVPGSDTALDYAHECGGTVKALFDGRTIDQLRADYPGITVGTEAEHQAAKTVQHSFITHQ